MRSVVFAFILAIAVSISAVGFTTNTISTSASLNQSETPVTVENLVTAKGYLKSLVFSPDPILTTSSITSAGATVFHSESGNRIIKVKVCVKLIGSLSTDPCSDVSGGPVCSASTAANTTVIVIVPLSGLQYNQVDKVKVQLTVASSC